MSDKVLVYLGGCEGGSLENLVKNFDRVYVFEALPQNVARLRQRFSAFPHVVITWAAVSDTKEDGGTVVFNVSSNNMSSSLGTFKPEWLSNRTDGLTMTQVNVPTINLERFCAKENITQIDLYCSDIQGADLMVLLTVEKSHLAKGLIKSIQTETTKDGKQNIYLSMPSNELSAFRKLLEPYGYQLTGTGWGNLVSGKFETVPDDWWEFDSLWELKPTPPTPFWSARSIKTIDTERCTSYLSLWNKFWQGRSSNEENSTMKMTAQFFNDDKSISTLEDWGCGVPSFRKYLGDHIKYAGIDGSITGEPTKLADLCLYQSFVDAIYVHHVLEVNWQWRQILKNILYSFRKRAVIVIFTPWAEKEVAIQMVQMNDKVSVPYLSLCKTDVIQIINEYAKTCKLKLSHNMSEIKPSPTSYGEEHVIYLTKS